MMDVKDNEQAEAKARDIIAQFFDVKHLSKEDRLTLYHLARECVGALHDAGPAIPPDRIVALDGWPAGWVLIQWLQSWILRLRKVQKKALPGKKDFPRHKLVF